MAERIVWIVSVVIVALGLALAAPKDDLTTDYARQIIRSAKVAEMQAMLNPKAAPCDDFYEYACGSWHRHNPAQFNGNQNTDTFQLLSRGFDRRLQSLLQSKDEQAKSTAEQNLHIFYESCLKANRDDVKYKLALHNIRDQYEGSDFSWWRSVARIQHAYNKDIIISVEVMPDIRNNTVTRVYLSPPEIIPLSETSILNMFEVAHREKELKHLLALSADAAEETAEQINKFENQLILASMSSSTVSLENGTILYNVSELQQKFSSHLNLTEFLELTLGTNEVPEQVYVYNVDYLENALRVIEHTPNTMLEKYVAWKLLQEFMVEGDKQKDKWCIKKSRSYFSMLTDHLIYQQYRSAEVEAEVVQLWEDIRGVFRQELAGDKLDWISNKTRQLAIEKLEQMKLFINSYDKENFEDLYGKLTLDSNKYVNNVQELLRALATHGRQKKDGPPLISTGFLSYTPTYTVTDNTISIPVALMQPLYFWGPNYPQALKYSTLGYMLAHEMIHGFDDVGNSFDAQGNLKSWWDRRSRYEFEERRKCFRAQYHEYKYGSERLPLQADQSENIADNGGVRLAYAAYHRWVQQQPEQVLQQETLAKLKLDNRQLFFLGFAQVLCNDVQSLFKKTLVSSDEHAPNMYRVIGSLSNFQEFAWVYNCPRNATMDPEYKCVMY